MSSPPPSPAAHDPAGIAAYARIESAIAYLCQQRSGQPDLGTLARYLGLSASHTQRLFSRWAGVSPKRFMQFLTVEHAKHRMAQTGGVLQASLAAGLSGPGRLHDLFVNMEAMSPGEFQRAAAGLPIRYGAADSPFGLALIAFTERGICHLSFVDSDALPGAVEALRRQWPGAILMPDDGAAADLLNRVFSRPLAAAGQGLSLWISGTNFQIQVWRALLRIPFAGLLSYGQLAVLLGRPRAARAVGGAVARNPVAFLIPCHRVLRESGEFGDYHWGGTRKAAICTWEAASAEHPPDDEVGG